MVQELMGGRFGEMSTLMNYTFQSFNFRSRQKARPFYDLVANIAAEEYGHIELVAAAINTMLTGASANKKAPNNSMTSLKDEAIILSISRRVARARCARTQTASRGMATMSSPPAIWSRT